MIRSMIRKRWRARVRSACADSGDGGEELDVSAEGAQVSVDGGVESGLHVGGFVDAVEHGAG